MLFLSIDMKGIKGMWAKVQRGAGDYIIYPRDKSHGYIELGTWKRRKRINAEHWDCIPTQSVGTRGL